MCVCVCVFIHDQLARNNLPRKPTEHIAQGAIEQVCAESPLLIIAPWRWLFRPPWESVLWNLWN